MDANYYLQMSEHFAQKSKREKTKTKDQLRQEIVHLAERIVAQGDQNHAVKQLQQKLKELRATWDEYGFGPFV